MKPQSGQTRRWRSSPSGIMRTIGPGGLDSTLMGVMWRRRRNAASGTAGFSVQPFSFAPADVRITIQSHSAQSHSAQSHSAKSDGDVDVSPTGGAGVLDRLVPPGAAAGLSRAALLAVLRAAARFRTASG